MLYEITMAVCSILHGGCHAEVLKVEVAQSVIPYEQMKYVQFEMAKWSADNPEWSIAKWALHPMSRIAKS